jgi:GTPase involved in cell partitioning and DNA repair
MIIILFCIYIIIKCKDSVLNFIIGIILASEMLVWLIQIWLEYKKYNENLQKRKNEIEKIKIKKLKKEDLVSLQKLIEERRNLKLVPFNSIHKYIADEMHELIKNK